MNSAQQIHSPASERKEHGTTRHNILYLLRRHGQMTATELSQELNIGAVGVRQHLTLLERDNMVQVAGLRRSVGRPSYLYTLTNDAEQHFPKAYDRLAITMLTYIERQGGNEAISDALAARRSEQVASISQRLEGKPRREQIAELAAILSADGYMCEYEELGDGSFVLTHYNCPVDCIARQHAQICMQELLLYREVLGVTVERETTMVEGNRYCRYHIPA